MGCTQTKHYKKNHNVVYMYVQYYLKDIQWLYEGIKYEDKIEVKKRKDIIWSKEPIYGIDIRVLLHKKTFEECKEFASKLANQIIEYCIDYNHKYEKHRYCWARVEYCYFVYHDIKIEALK